MADAMQAHQHAYFNAHVLHRDISAGNILITYEGKGLLIDWDLCVKLMDPNNCNKFAPARLPVRTGTWQFMSAALLQDNDKSFRFTKHIISGSSSSRFLRAFDEEYEDEDGVKGGDLKKGFLLGRDIPRVVKFNSRPQLDALIGELTDTFQSCRSMC
ncbi:hypothetical protein M378DRAFT_16984 [Amanita muscaria Koide BX008]|uniref:Fungal-type protein kinase domain-containing protein n=1 Tax=Amanita muscaria (strain Koide BX008) TaxID=946122 RepID=A0A0C2S1T2_AMAMK|nr:hypothetical protein M378DRAFT_16984 [Amanita muscaria Koide BX008]